MVKGLPSDLRYDAALAYYPYGGDVRSDADGKQASEAGERLYAYYQAECGYDPSPPTDSGHVADVLGESMLEEFETLIRSCPGVEDLSVGPIPTDVALEVLLIPDPEPAVVCPMLSAAVGQ